MTQHSNTYDLLPDALRDALGQVLADNRRQCGVLPWKRSLACLGLPARPALKPPGKLPIAKMFEPGKVYYEGDEVVRDGSTLQALRDTGHGVAHADRICLAVPAAMARMDRHPISAGSCDVTERYAKLDIVVCDGAAFIDRRDNPGICPGRWLTGDEPAGQARTQG